MQALIEEQNAELKAKLAEQEAIVTSADGCLALSDSVHSKPTSSQLFLGLWKDFFLGPLVFEKQLDEISLLV